MSLSIIWMRSLEGADYSGYNIEKYCCSAMKDTLDSGSTITFVKGAMYLIIGLMFYTGTTKRKLREMEFCPFCGDKIRAAVR